VHAPTGLPIGTLTEASAIESFTGVIMQLRKTPSRILQNPPGLTRVVAVSGIPPARYLTRRSSPAPHRPVIDRIRAEIPCRRCIGVEAGGDGWDSWPDLVANTAPLEQPDAIGADEVAVIALLRRKVGSQAKRRAQRPAGA